MVDAAKVTSSVSAKDILSIIYSSTDIDLSGITVEFFPPDTAHPDARAAPKSLSIDNAKAHNDTNASKQESSTAAENDTVNVNFRQSSAKAEATRSDTKILSPLDWVALSIIPVAVILLIIAIYLTVIKNR